MNELLNVNAYDKPDCVSARELHEFLEVSSQFSKWINRRIDDLGFVEGVDFERIGVSKNGYVDIQGLTPQKLSSMGVSVDYAVTLDMAKHLSMVEKTERGQQARQYFIDVEKKAKEAHLAFKALSPAEQLLQQAQMMVNIERRQKENAEKIKALDTDLDEVKARVGISVNGYLPVLGFCTKYELPISAEDMKRIGKRASAICKRRGIEKQQIPDVRYGTIGAYPEDVLDEALQELKSEDKIKVKI